MSQPRGRPSNNWMKLTKGVPRMAVGAWSRSAPLRGTTPRLRLDASPSQLIQVLSGPTRKRPGLHSTETATATDARNGPRQRTAKATGRNSNGLARQRTKPAVVGVGPSSPAGGRGHVPAPSSSRSGGGPTRREQGLNSHGGGEPNGKGEAKRRTTLNRAARGEPLRGAPNGCCSGPG